MTTNKIFFIDETHAQVTKAFAKKARTFNTPEYKLWKAYLAENPGAQMVTKTIKRNHDKRTYRNLTYKNMELYIRENAPERLPEFEKQKKSAVIQSSPYHAVLAWFLQQFPDYDSYKQFFEEQEKERQGETQQGPQIVPTNEALPQAASF